MARQSGRSGKRRRGSRPGGRGSRPPSLLDRAVEVTRGIAAADPLTAEIIASGLLSASRQELADEDADREWAERLIDRFARTRSADGLACLIAIRALLPPEWRESTDAAIGALGRLVLPGPAWASDIEAPRALDAWSATDEYGDQTLVGVGFRHGAWVPHGLQFMVDRNFEGLIRQATVAEQPDLLLRAWTDTAPPDLVPHSVSSQEVADRLSQGIRMFDMYLAPPADDEVWRLMPLLRARLRGLPAAQEPPEEKPLSDARRRRLARDFARSDEAPPGIDAELLAGYFVDYGADWSGGDALRWSPVRVELLLLDWFPRKVALADADVQSVPVALRGWVRWAAREKGISAEGLAGTLEAIDRFAGEFVSAMSDESTFGPAKSLADAMLREGVDMADQAAVDRWIGAWNARRLAEIGMAASTRHEEAKGKHRR